MINDEGSIAIDGAAMCEQGNASVSDADSFEIWAWKSDRLDALSVRYFPECKVP